MARVLAALLVFGTLFWGVPVPAGDAEVPERYMSVDEVKALLDKKQPVTFIDVRPREQFDLLHIKGARSIPLNDLPQRLGEVPKQGLTVLY